MIVQTAGIVLKSFDFRETSRIVTFFTREHGRVSGVLKGIRTSPKKFGSSVEKFSVNDIVYYQYRNSDLHLVSQCDLRQYFFPIRQDLPRSLAASYMLELIYVVMPPEEKNLQVYRLMVNFLEALEQTTDIHQLVHVFQIKMLLYSGFRPHLDACVHCKQQILAQARFSLKEGGLLCPRCQPGGGDVQPVSQGAIASILHVERSSWENSLRLKLNTAVRRELKQILNSFLVCHLGKRLRSARYLR